MPVSAVCCEVIGEILIRPIVVVCSKIVEDVSTRLTLKVTPGVKEEVRIVTKPVPVGFSGAPEDTTKRFVPVDRPEMSEGLMRSLLVDWTGLVEEVASSVSVVCAGALGELI